VVLVGRRQFEDLVAVTGPAPAAPARAAAGASKGADPQAGLPRLLTFDDGRASLEPVPTDVGALADGALADGLLADGLLADGALADGLRAEPVLSPVSQIAVLWGDWYVLADDDFASLPAGAVSRSGSLTVYDWAGSD